MRLRARWVVPVGRPVIEDGEVVVSGERIAEVRQRPVDGNGVPDALEFGEAAILPGLVNAHAHLEYTFLRGAVGDARMFEWLARLMDMKTQMAPEDWVASATLGAAEAAVGGITTVADCSDSGASVKAMASTGLRGIVYREVFGIDESETVGQTLSVVEARIGEMRADSTGSLVRPGISPHSPYTVRPSLMRALAAYASEHDLPVCIHAAESQPEVELLLRGTGVRAAQLAARDVAWAPPGVGSIEYLERLGALGSRTLLAHATQISSADARAAERAGTAVAYCPRSNARLGNGVAPLWLLIQSTTTGSDVAGPRNARVGLGTDSVVSSGNGDMFEEMRFGLIVQRAARHHAVRPCAEDMLVLATLGGARAMCLDAEIGSLEAGKLADLTVVGLDGLRCAPCHDPVSAIVYSACASDCLLTMVNGRVVARNRRLVGHDLGQAKRRMRVFRRRLRERSSA